MLGLIQFISLTLGAFVALFPNEMDFVLEHWGNVGQPSEGLAHWPTDFSADTFPVQCHSHNDYWRRVPLYEAIAYGCTGVEADVWLFDEELYVGHTTSSLTKNRTLKSLYLSPLMEILEKQNPITHFHPTHTEINGVFDTKPEQTLILLVDFKTSGPEIFPFVQDQLEPLRQKGYLTHWNGSAIISRPITIVASGNAPYDLVSAHNTYRDIFFDAPLDHLTTPNPLSPHKSSTGKNQGQGHSVSNTSTPLPPYSPTNSYYASVSFKKSIGFPHAYTRLTAREIDLIRSQINDAHTRGLKVRYWGIPSWPRGLRNHIWHVLIREGADMLNVDDLQTATKRDWMGRGKGWWI
ncbi:hypothetical protein UCRPC4_g06975 [Phaeomoniella chlamydospora]|uniref:Altered inheritance of mitochondria protein 6 n=1 Tax=Phaeomoniella chlamydospora TaxID=158046 RepID=A0A0G2G8G4_PHACM|nr:hypothetical protein UCRPC4_g06975 [Phaeomoniella chlamydospora]